MVLFSLPIFDPTNQTIVHSSLTVLPLYNQPTPLSLTLSSLVYQNQQQHHLPTQFKTMENLQPQPQNKTIDQKPISQKLGADIPQEAVECPRCNSNNTKFCYYNNYNLSQPRHYCKNCRRYWTKGGTLRNIPIGGGTRKYSRRATSAPAKRPTKTPAPQSVSSVERDQPLLLDCGVGTFSSLLATNGHYQLDGGFLGGLGSGEVTSSSMESGGNGVLWPGTWADLSIYTPGPTFQ